MDYLYVCVFVCVCLFWGHVNKMLIAVSQGTRLQNVNMAQENGAHKNW